QQVIHAGARAYDPVIGDTPVAAIADEVRIARVRPLRGPNLWSISPVLIAELRGGALASLSPRDVVEIAEHVAAIGVEENSLTSWGTLLLALGLALQRQAGAPDANGRVVGGDPVAGRWTVVMGFDEEDLAVDALHDAARIIRNLLRGDDPEIETTVAALTRTYHRARPGPTSLVMMEAARRRGIPVRRNLEDGIIQLGLGATLRRLRSTMTDFTSAIAAEITSDRQRTKQALARVGLGVPDGDMARTLAEALEIVDEIGFPVLLKPLDANNGRGISGRIDDLDGVRQAWPAAVAEHPVVVVERFALGNDYRVLVVAGRVVAVAERIPAHVRGDGVRTVRSLAVDRTDDIHPGNRALCELAAGAVALDVAGLDVLSADIAVPFRENGAVVIEVNASPGIRMHTHPDQGIPRDVAGAILDMLYPPGAPTTIPVVAVTGTNGKTTTTRLVAHLFREHGRRVGYTTTDGVYYHEHLLMEGDLTGPFAANIILSHPQVDVAVLETARGGILRAGLGFEECDVAVVLNVAADHLGLHGIDTIEQLAEVKAVVPSVVRRDGYAVLNADDHLVAAMRERTPGKVVFFSTMPTGTNPLVESHLESGGTVARLEGTDEVSEELVIRRGAERLSLGRLVDFPLAFGGHARFQIGNLLAAALAALVQGVPLETIRHGLSTFAPSASRTPGRLNVIETTRGRVVLDYAHNAAAITGLLDFVRRLPADRRMALLGVPGDRRDEDLREVGRLCAGLDLAIFKEHPHYRRGRPPGEIARMMADGALSAGMPPDRVWSFDDEAKAVTAALGVMQRGDVVALIADDAVAVREQLRPYLLSDQPGD
ncbi:MAG TPA: Mur ligase family protein, partial [Gemmatimonadaceae bacterium]